LAGVDSGIHLGGPGITGVFTLTPRTPGVVEYVYYFYWDWDNPTVVPADADGRASFTFTADASGSYPMQVYSRTADGKQSNLGRDYYIVVNQGRAEAGSSSASTLTP
jgi:hypothetical protein